MFNHELRALSPSAGNELLRRSGQHDRACSCFVFALGYDELENNDACRSYRSFVSPVVCSALKGK